MDYLLLIIGIVAGVVIGYLLAKTMSSGDKPELELERQNLKVENAQLKSTLERAEKEAQSAKSDHQELEQQYRQELKSSTEWKGKWFCRIYQI